MGITYIKQEILVCPMQDKTDGLGRELENVCSGPFFTAQAVDHSPFSTSSSRRESKTSPAALSLGVESEPIFAAAVPDVCSYSSRYASPGAERGPKGENMGT